MAKFLKTDIIQTIRQTGIVPVFYHKEAETAQKVLWACYEGGIRVFEFTNRGDFAHEVFLALAKFSAKECPDMILGAGSIVDAPTAVLYMQSGANFIVGPCFNPEIARTCNRRQLPYIPGCGSVSEISAAQEAGCDICKIFPAGEVGGPSFVKNVLAPMPWSLLMATGGVEPTEANLKAWFSARVTAVGMGSKLFPREAIADKNWNAITTISKQCIEYSRMQ